MTYYIFQFDRRNFLGFTLIELLSVVAIISLLLALLFPAIQAARSSSRRLSCSSKMRQIGIAIHSYNDVHGQLPPSKWGIEEYDDGDINNTPEVKSPKHNILTFLLPYFEMQAVYCKIDFSVHWYNIKNDAATKCNLPLFQCPEAPHKNRYGDNIYYVSDYASAEMIEKTEPILKLFEDNIVAKRDGDSYLLAGMLQPDGEATTAEAVSDGMSNTMMFFECGGRPFVYGLSDAEVLGRSESSADWSSNKSPFYIQEVCGGGKMQLMNCTNYEEIYSFHAGGGNFLFGDGGVRFILESIHPDKFISAFTATSGDVATPP
ncbi:MAG: DUF1559 domain-containing protein [Planctomycetaceae bacterium]|jgi:prepilin-type N-terminal cleavage/methylation domain-containing protein/prepilin-type processing-associated H-X9-DG protein|nr:DUF1559 domain-containing protein [Planctomycetaceae bacterium]